MRGSRGKKRGGPLIGRRGVNSASLKLARKHSAVEAKNASRNALSSLKDKGSGSPQYSPYCKLLTCLVFEVFQLALEFMALEGPVEGREVLCRGFLVKRVKDL